jgi:serine/threonine-protein kinase
MEHAGAEQVAQRAFDLGLLDERQLQAVWGLLGTRSAPLSELLQLLVRREYLTNYQVERLVKGERSGFFYGDYKVLYLVGSGTFARVFRAVHRRTGETVAIKALRNRYSENPGQYGLFVREGRLGIALRHPNIVPIYEVVSEGRTHFLTMEFIEGWNLRDIVKVRKQIEPLQATSLMIDMAEGLRYAFAHGLTHRDLKLNNVLVSSGGQAKLVDFGLAALDETLSDDLLADVPNTRTIDYAALERATGVRKDDTRSDIYFLGCIYYHMLTGQPPLSDTKDRLQRLSKSRFLDVAPIRKLVPTLPHWVTMVVNKAMMLDPTRRYQTPAALLTDLHAAKKRLEDTAQAGPSGTAGTAVVKSPALRQHTVMVVESNQQMQDLFRDGLKRAGYRVLLTSDPVRALARFRQDATAAECVVFNAQELGQSALEQFNALDDDPKTRFVRAVLLLDPSQELWKAEAKAAPHRLVLMMPLRMKELRAALASLIEPAPAT